MSAPLDLVAIVAMAVNLYGYVLLARIIFTWIRPSGELLNKIYGYVYDVTEPYLKIFRGIIPMVDLGGAGLDLSPIVAFLVLDLLIKRLLVSLVAMFV